MTDSTSGAVPIDMKKRAAAAQATLDKFKDRPFKPGRYDCVQMSGYNLKMLGRPEKLLASLKYRSIRRGEELLKAQGFDDLVGYMDAHFERIPPAAALPADIVAMPGLEGPGALTVALGNGRVIGYHEHAIGACVMQPHDYVGAWRVSRPGDLEAARSLLFAAHDADGLSEFDA